MSPNGRGWGVANDYSCAQCTWSQINFGDLTLYLTFGLPIPPTPAQKKSSTEEPSLFSICRNLAGFPPWIPWTPCPPATHHSLSTPLFSSDIWDNSNYWGVSAPPSPSFIPYPSLHLQSLAEQCHMLHHDP
jgi:hypothetical protein